MKIETKYSYQKRIKELEQENRDLRSNYFSYRDVVINIHNTICDVLCDDKVIHQGWILKQIGRLLK